MDKDTRKIVKKLAAQGVVVEKGSKHDRLVDASGRVVGILSQGSKSRGANNKAFIRDLRNAGYSL